MAHLSMHINFTANEVYVELYQYFSYFSMSVFHCCLCDILVNAPSDAHKNTH